MGMIAYCGLDCGVCPAYKATKENNQELREETAKRWSSFLGTDLKAEDIHCLGCKSDVLFGYCKTCEIKSCTTEKELNHCGECKEYACEKLQRFYKDAPEAKQNIDNLLQK